MRILFLFLDGIGLGRDDPEHNPFAAATLPTLTSFTDGQPWTLGLPRMESERAIFIPTDACLGVAGKPQSATGQATIMTGVNVPQVLGYHYGPKPNAEVAAVIQRESVIAKLTGCGLRVGLINAYPSAYLDSIKRGKRLRSANQLAMAVGGVRMLDDQALIEKRALAADFTGELWRSRLGYRNAPLLTPFEAGQSLARLARDYDLAFFDHWLTDYVGHRQDRQQAIDLLELIDGVLAGVLAEWDDSEGLIVLTSDHGNIEDLNQRGHTRNPVPTLLIGAGRDSFADGLSDLTRFAPAILRALGIDGGTDLSVP